ncbi:pentapeptide repeat-containing protein [Streptomyces sp. NPDC086549]|uniref:pentapeptide repeat-containing protein n=1 Tax=Streptomyces sp. NPDC086549 TaxID=3365752 RepID=UPI00380B71BD
MCLSVLLVALVVVVAPRYLLDWDAPSTPAADRAKAINDIRATLLQGLAGVALLVGAFFTWRQLQVTRQGQITERFTAAVERLGSASMEVRIGSIYAMERIAYDSLDERATIAEVLCAFVKRTALASPPAARPSPRDTAHKGELARSHAGEVPLPVRAPDVQAAMSVLGRRARPRQDQELHLDRADLRGLRLSYADLADADLHYADLTDAVLIGADLERADLTGIWLAGAVLIKANLDQADLRNVVLWHARLDDADLRATDLSGADLTGAVVGGARFDLSDLRGTDFTSVNLAAATFTGAVADATTVWPADFDVAASGVLPTYGAPPLRPQTYLRPPPA